MYTVHKSFCLLFFYIYILFGFVLYLLFIEKKRVSKRKEFDRGKQHYQYEKYYGKKCGNHLFYSNIFVFLF